MRSSSQAGVTLAAHLGPRTTHGPRTKNHGPRTDSLLTHQTGSRASGSNREQVRLGPDAPPAIDERRRRREAFALAPPRGGPAHRLAGTRVKQMAMRWTIRTISGGFRAPLPEGPLCDPDSPLSPAAGGDAERHTCRRQHVAAQLEDVAEQGRVGPLTVSAEVRAVAAHYSGQSGREQERPARGQLGDPGVRTGRVWKSAAVTIPQSGSFEPAKARAQRSLRARFTGSRSRRSQVVRGRVARRSDARFPVMPQGATMSRSPPDLSNSPEY